ncbi:TonB-dependent receptor [Chitinophaga sp. sic0106]|uniref:TonB-dependent receptor n=1 Tax=Chitinophaga sp. sic0106 TaxID=2854785 RepID=UPI001C480E2E|nr:TonB-dependent receptor [Chitinophaga sp. sic0106]MBV7529837.1 TonB-dependent receptor family protein [Chitinophaga sp. sic0106]
MKKLIFLVALLFAMQTTRAQSAIVKGKVADTLNRTSLSNAVVAVLRAKDSTLYRFQRTGGDGRFELKSLQPGQYLVLITYPKFADYVESVTLSDSTLQNMGTVNLIQKSRLLQEVVVKQQVAAIRFKGDTTEFNADSFKTAANASVEELLKIMPGLQVDKDGKVTAMGQQVKKVLVEGEEFFGDDPTLVTKNLRADMVDKVQVFDKKSEQADFTGVDDGEKSRTINITLKENKKKGYFGKASAGGGTNGYFDTQVMANLFQGKRKVALFGIASNTGKTGLNWDERDKFGQSDADNMSYDEASGFYTFSGGGDDLGGWDGRFDGRGYPLAQTGGVHYEDKWNQDKQRMAANVKGLRMGVEQWSSNLNQNILNNAVQYSKDTNTSKVVDRKVRADGMYEWKIDSMATVKFNVQAGRDNHTSFSRTKGEVTNENDQLLNDNENNTSSDGQRDKFGVNLLWKQRFQKKGRTVTVNFSQNYEKSNSNMLQLSHANVYTNGLLDSVLTVDQHKLNTSEQTGINGNVAYTEPLGKNGLLQFSYGLQLNNNRSGRSSYNKADNGKYEDLDSLYSNDFKYNVLTNVGGLSYNYNYKKFRLNVGAKVGATQYHQDNLFTGNTWDRSFLNWNPRLRFSYQRRQQQSFSLSYSGYTRQPSVNQLQPLVSNDNQINIVVGNPELKPAFNNSVSLNFGDYKVFSERSLWVNVSYNFAMNDFGNATEVDASGRSKSMTVNVGGNRGVNYWMSGEWKLKWKDIRIGVESQGEIGKRTNLVNLEKNVSNTYNIGAQLQLRKFKEKKYEVRIRGGVSYNSSVSSIQQSLTTTYWEYPLNANVSLHLPWKLEFNTDVDYAIRPKTALFTTSNSMAIWNAGLGKKFGKGDVFELRCSVEDLLKQRRGINRNMYGNNVSQSTYGIIGRYAMVTFLWNFNKFGAGK